MGVSQQSIADALGLSRTTVTKILNRDPKYSASEATRDLVFQTAERMGYDFTTIRRPFKREYGRAELNTPCHLEVVLENGDLFDTGNAVARNIGEWVAAKDVRGLEWIRPSNTFHAVVTGVGALLAFSVASNILELAPFLGFVGGLLATIGSIAAVATVLIGFGAVLLTRAGRQSEFYDGGDPFDDGPIWEEEPVSDEVIDVEELRAEPEATVGAEEMADSVAEGGDEASDEAPERGDSSDD